MSGEKRIGLPEGLTLEEIRERAVQWLEELGIEYGDDGKLSTREVVRSVAHLVEGLGEDAGGELGDKLSDAGRLLGFLARFFPGPD